MTSLDGFQLSRLAAERYKQYVYPIMVPWIAEMLTIAKLRKGDRVLDLACGTGFVAFEAEKAVGRGGKVVGLDLNAGMIDVARQAAKTSNSHIKWEQGDAASLPFEDNSFDVVLCQQGAQFFPDTVIAFREIRRVLSPDGRFIFTVWGSIQGNLYFETMANVLGRRLGPQMEAGVHNIFSKSYSNLFEQALRDAGFSKSSCFVKIKPTMFPQLETFLPGHYSALPIADVIASLPDEQRQAIFDEILLALKPYQVENGAEIPSSSEIIVAQR